MAAGKSRMPEVIAAVANAKAAVAALNFGQAKKNDELKLATAALADKLKAAAAETNKGTDTAFARERTTFKAIVGAASKSTVPTILAAVATAKTAIAAIDAAQVARSEAFKIETAALSAKLATKEAVVLQEASLLADRKRMTKELAAAAASSVGDVRALARSAAVRLAALNSTIETQDENLKRASVQLQSKVEMAAAIAKQREVQLAAKSFAAKVISAAQLISLDSETSNALNKTRVALAVLDANIAKQDTAFTVAAAEVPANSSRLAALKQAQVDELAAHVDDCQAAAQAFEIALKRQSQLAVQALFTKLLGAAAASSSPDVVALVHKASFALAELNTTLATQQAALAAAKSVNSSVAVVRALKAAQVTELEAVVSKTENATAIVAAVAREKDAATATVMETATTAEAAAAQALERVRAIVRRAGSEATTAVAAAGTRITAAEEDNLAAGLLALREKRLASLSSVRDEAQRAVDAVTAARSDALTRYAIQRAVLEHESAMATATAQAQASTAHDMARSKAALRDKGLDKVAKVVASARKAVAVVETAVAADKRTEREVIAAKRFNHAALQAAANADVKEELDARVAALRQQDVTALASLQHKAALAVKAVEDIAAAKDPRVSEVIDAVSRAHDDAVEASKPTTPPPSSKALEGTKPPATTWLSNVVRTRCILEGVNLAEFTSAAQDGVRVAFARLTGVHRSQVSLSELSARSAPTHAGAVQFHLTIEGTLQALQAPVMRIKGAMAAPTSFRALVQDEMAVNIAATGGDANVAVGTKIIIETPPYVANNTPPPTPSPTPPPTPSPTPAKPLAWSLCDNVTCSTRDVNVVSAHGSSTHTTIMVSHHHLDHSNEHRCTLNKTSRQCECMCRGLHGEITYETVNK